MDERERQTKPSAAARVAADVYIHTDTAIEMRDFGSGVYIRIGSNEQYADLNLGYDDKTRHDACDRLIAALTEARAWVPAPEPEAVPV